MSDAGFSTHLLWYNDVTHINCFCKSPYISLAPYQRPAGAPVIELVRHNQAWYKQALTGVPQPYPRSLYFLENQGNWYTPFTHPGMTGRYDLRGWHQ